VIAAISSSAFDSFFAWAPWVVGIVIYLAFYIAKRHENAARPATTAQATYACANCGRRGALEQMVPQDHGGAVGWYCTNCATSQVTAV
jgi:hypothetical protein